MFTVAVGFDGSGKCKIRRPFPSRYSVIPSSDVTRSTPCGIATTPTCAAYAGMQQTSRTRMKAKDRPIFMGTSEMLRLNYRARGTQRHKGTKTPTKAAVKTTVDAALLGVFVPLCLCVPLALFQLQLKSHFHFIFHAALD